MKIRCFTCNKPVTNELPDNMVILRGTAECPECAAKKEDELKKYEARLLNAFQLVKNGKQKGFLKFEEFCQLMDTKYNDKGEVDENP